MEERFKVEDLRRHLLAGPMTWRFCWGEIRELAEAVQERDVSHIREEWNDVWFCLWGMAGQATSWVRGWTIPKGLGHASCVKFAARIDVWVEICEKHDVVLHLPSLKEGSNFRKRSKVARILRAHGLRSGQMQWAWIEDRVGGFEPQS